MLQFVEFAPGDSRLARFPYGPGDQPFVAVMYHSPEGPPTWIATVTRPTPDRELALPRMVRFPFGFAIAEASAGDRIVVVGGEGLLAPPTAKSDKNPVEEATRMSPPDTAGDAVM